MELGDTEEVASTYSLLEMWIKAIIKASAYLKKRDFASTWLGMVAWTKASNHLRRAGRTATDR